VTSPSRPKALPPDLPAFTIRAQAALAQTWPDATAGELIAFTAGTSSLTYRCDIEGAGESSVVVKVAVPGLPPVRNRDVLRQARVLQALADVDGIKVPQVYGSDAGDPPIVPPLFVMQLLAGESYEPRHEVTPESFSPEQTAARELGAATMLASLHRVDPAQVGLADEPVITIAAEVDRWATAFASCPLPEETGRLETSVRGKLLAHVPAPLPAVIQHGDWRLGNMQCEGSSINGVIDWEIWSVGDPRMDLGWLLMIADADHPMAANRDVALPSPDEVRAAYEQARGAAVPDAAWFDALVRYKQAAATALLVKNARKRNDTHPRWDNMEGGIAALLEEADRILTA
jgi:aminoglycoside phosphotransferase (APT) family kinase protein